MAQNTDHDDFGGACIWCGETLTERPYSLTTSFEGVVSHYEPLCSRQCLNAFAAEAPPQPCPDCGGSGTTWTLADASSQDEPILPPRCSSCEGTGRKPGGQ